MGRSAVFVYWQLLTPSHEGGGGGGSERLRRLGPRYRRRLLMEPLHLRPVPLRRLPGSAFMLLSAVGFRGFLDDLGGFCDHFEAFHVILSEF